MQKQRVKKKNMSNKRERAYYLGHLKSAKSSETVGFAEKNFSFQKNRNSENGRVSRLRREKC